jgi:hypothetical protein
MSQTPDAAHEEALQDNLKKAFDKMPVIPYWKLENSHGDVGWRESEEKVDHPLHYAPGEFEHYKVAIALGWDKDAFIYNTTKYLWRVGRKTHAPVIEDLKKARWYLERRIEQEEKQERQLFSDISQEKE